MATDPPDDRSDLVLSVGSPGGRRRGLKVPFVAATLFFYLAPLASLLAHPPAPAALALLLVGWAVFGAVLLVLLRTSPFARVRSGPWLAVAVAVIAGIAVVAQVAFGVGEAAALYFYAGVTASRLVPERWAIGGIAGVRARRRDRHGVGLWRRGSGRDGGRHGGDDLPDAVRAGGDGTLEPRAPAAAARARVARRGRGAQPDRPRPPRLARAQPLDHRAQERARPAHAPR